MQAGLKGLVFIAQFYFVGLNCLTVQDASVVVGL